MGLLTAAVGIFMIIYPFATATVTAELLGWSLILAGVAQFVFALNSQSVGNFFLKVLLSIVYGVCGIALALFPIPGVAAMTGVVGTLLLLQAGLEAATAFQLKPLGGWGWFLFDGACSLVLGILILAQWPSSSFWAIGTLVGVSVLVNGVTRVGIAARIHSGARDVQKLARAA